VRDAAKASNKQVELTLGGAETELDNNIIQQISDPLVHLVRNAVAHGLEKHDERYAAGKPDAAAAARASGASFAQVIVTCLTAHTPTVAGGASQKKKADQLRLKTLGPTARRATR